MVVMEWILAQLFKHLLILCSVLASQVGQQHIRAGGPKLQDGFTVHTLVLVWNEAQVRLWMVAYDDKMRVSPPWHAPGPFGILPLLVLLLLGCGSTFLHKLRSR